MPEEEQDVKKNTYSSPVAFAYIFNLIVGVGVLALPKAFNDAGLVLGTILLLILCFMSYTSACYVIECMAAANAFQKMTQRREKVNTLQQTKSLNSSRRRVDSLSVSSEKRQVDEKSLGKEKVEESVSTIPPYCVDVSGVHDPDSKEEDVNITEVTPLMQSASDSDNDFEIVVKYELGSMATMFYPKLGVALYYICVCMYLFGDLSIYAVTASASLTRVLCNMYGYYHNSSSINDSDSELSLGETDDNKCIGSISKLEMYYIFLAGFILCIGPFAFFNMTKTKLMQITTTILRYLAFLLMISLALVRIFGGTHSMPTPANIKAFPSLFGVSVYAFMCQHSLPGMVTPMASKRNVFKILIGDFAVILVFYYMLVYTGVFAFKSDDMQQLYSLDFFNPGDPLWKLVFGIYLALFPVFTLSASFPIISVTLRENLKSLTKLIMATFKIDVGIPVLVDRLLFPILALAPPVIIAFSTQQIDILVSITGSFPGVGVQYIIPATLILMVHWNFRKSFGKYRNPYKTPMSHLLWIGIVLIWSFISVILIIVDMAISPPKKTNPFN